MTSLDKVLSKLDKVQKIGNDRYKSICPAHDDKTPSLAIANKDNRLLIHCFSGCQTIDILNAIGLSFADLMPEQPLGNHKKVRKPFYASEILNIIRGEARLTYIYASDMAKGLILTSKDKERLLLAASRINHALEVSNGY